jgi:hypothetical protein
MGAPPWVFKLSNPVQRAKRALQQKHLGLWLA